MRTVHSYARFSAKIQELGDSERRQIEGAKSFVAKHGFQLSDLVLFDKGKSGFKGNKQDALNSFLEVMRKKDGRINSGDILLVEAVDRLCRKGIRPTQKVVHEILDYGIDIAILIPMEKIYLANDPNDIGGAIELAAFAYQAWLYSKNLSDRVTEFHTHALKIARETKKPINSGQPPNWLTRENNKFTIKKSANEAIKYIFTKTIEGIGGTRLAKELNNKYPTFARSEHWNEAYVTQIITDRRVLGEYQPKTGDIIQDYYPRLIDEKTWLQANQSRQNRKVERGPTGNFINIFTGLLWHEIDDCPVHIYSYIKSFKTKEKLTYRRLKSYHAQEGVKGASTATVDLEMFEKAIMSFTTNELDASIFTGGASNALELKSLMFDLSRKQDRLKELESELATDGDLKIIIPTMKKLEGQIKELKEQVNSAKLKTTFSEFSHLENLFTNIKKRLDRQKLREALKRVIKQIRITPIKLGKLRRDKVICYTEIIFHSGLSKFLLIYPDGYICANKGLSEEKIKKMVATLD